MPSKQALTPGRVETEKLPPLQILLSDPVSYGMLLQNKKNAFFVLLSSVLGVGFSQSNLFCWQAAVCLQEERKGGEGLICYQPISFFFLSSLRQEVP